MTTLKSPGVFPVLLLIFSSIVPIYILDTGTDHPDVNVVERVDFGKWGTELDIARVIERY